MREVIQYATTKDLNLLLGTLADCDLITEERADLFYAVVDELERRGELQKTPENEIEVFIENTKRVSKGRGDAEIPAKESHPLMKHLPKIVEDARRDRAERRQRRIALLRLPTITASVIVILLLTNAVALANGHDFLGSVARWSKDAVYFVFGTDSLDEPTKGVTKEYDSLKMTLDDLGVQVDLPKHIPDGFMFASIEPDEPDATSNIVAWYVNGDDEFSIRIMRISELADVRFSESDGAEHAEVYPEANGKYLITTNESRIKAIWYQGIYEIKLQGNITYEQLTQILDSI